MRGSGKGSGDRHAAARVEKDSVLITPCEGEPLKLSLHLRHMNLLLDELDRRLQSKEVPGDSQSDSN